MNHGSLFSGIGGFDLAAEWMGWTNKFHCEWNLFGQKVLKHYWPEAESYTDITKTDFNIWRGKIDILTGGFPCQPYSQAGKRLGKEDDRHLWPEMLRAIREIQPKYVVGENVSGLINWNGGMVFDEVQAELEAEGYEVRPFILPACAVNAPHRRDRVWFVAYSKSYDNREQAGTNNGTRKNECGRNSEIWTEFTRYGNGRITSDTESKPSERMQSEQREFSKQKQGEFRGNGSGMGSFRNVADTNGERCDNGSDHREERHLQDDLWTSEKDQSERNGWKCGTGEIGSISSDTDDLGLRGQSDGIGKSGFIDQKSETNDWRDFPTQSPICSRNDGLSSRLDGITFPKWRNESIKAGGNAIVPQVALQIFKAIEQFNKIENGH